MSATRKLVVEVLGDAKGAQGTFKALSDGTESLGQQFTDFGKKVGIAFTALAAGTAVFAKSALDAAYEAQKVSAQTEAIIKATGEAANMSAKQVSDLAESLSFKTAVDDEAIQSSMNMLLTFKQVRNEVGEGNNVFDRASMAMLDLGNVFGSTDSAAMQLGKALSDPVKGITALRRAGVNFTEDQKSQIKALVESGDILSAQKIILGEVESQVGGTAAATATSAERMKIAFENLKERIGGMLLPAFESFSRFVVDRVIPAIDDLVEKYGPKIAALFDRIWSAVKNVGGILADVLFPVFKKIGDWMADNTAVVATFFGVIAGISTLAAIASLATALGSLFSPIGLIIGAIALVAAGFVFAYQHFEGFRNVVDTVAQFFVNQIVPMFASAFGWIADTVSAFAKGVADRWDDIQKATSNVFDFIKKYVETVLDVLAWLWDTFGGTILSTVQRIWGGITQVIRGAFDIVKGIFDFFLGVLSGNWGRAWEGIKSVLSGALGAIIGIANTLMAPILGAFSAIWEGIKSAASAAFGGLVWVVKGAINTVVDVINRFISIWNGIQFHAPQIRIPGTNWYVGGFTIGLPDLPHIPHLAEGGIVTTPSIVQIAEREPEAVIPLSKLELGGGATSVHINVTSADPTAVVEALKRYYRQNGAIPIRTMSP